MTSNSFEKMYQNTYAASHTAGEWCGNYGWLS